MARITGKKNIPKDIVEAVKNSYGKKPAREIAEQFSITEKSVYAIFIRAGVAKKKPKLSPEQHALIRDNYQSKPVEEVVEMLGGKISPQAIYSIARRSGIKKWKHFSDEEKSFISENIGKMSVKKIAAALGVSVHLIGGYARKIKVPLSDEEKSFIRENIGKMSVEKIAAALGASVHLIGGYAKKVNFSKKECAKKQAERKKEEKRFFEEAVAGIIKENSHLTISELAELTKLPKNKVSYLKLKFNIKKTIRGLTPEKILLIKENSDLPTKEMAKLVEASEDTVRCYRKKLGILNSPRFSEDAIRIITENSKLPAKELAELTKLPRNSVAYIKKKYKLQNS
jgi:DNA-binding CsgD family transcriptional regulator/DNA-binding transcriptional MerR regulator